MVLKNRTQTHYLHILIIFILVAVFTFPAFCFGATEKNITADISKKMRITFPNAPNPEGQIQLPADSILASGSIYKIVKETTLYIGNEKQKISMSELPVPCKAEITYQLLQNNARNALDIKIMQIYSGASTDWPLPAPE